MSSEPENPFHALPSMHHDSEPAQWSQLKPVARQMRSEATDAEAALWSMVRNRQILGVKFRRQYAIDRFVVDFASVERHLVIEIDGQVHDNQVDEDAVRQQCIEAHGYAVIRFTNEQVLRNPGQVSEAIAAALALRQSRSADE